MKKTIAVLLVLAMIVCICPANVFAAETPKISLTTDASTPLSVGDTFSVTASLENNTGFASLTLSLLWNSAVVEFKGFETVYNEDDEVYKLKDTILGQQVLFNDDTGKVANSRSGNSSRNGTIFVANFLVIGEGQCNIGIDQSSNTVFTFKDIDGNDIGVTVDTSAISDMTVGGEEEELDGYTASLGSASSNNEVASKGKITLNVGVDHSEDTVFNAAEIKLAYDGTKLTPDTDSIALSYKVEGAGTANAVLTIEDFGANKDLAYTYGIPFDAVEVTADTVSTVTLTSAKFVHKDNAKSSDLIAANNVPLTLDVTIKAETVDVTLTENGGSTTTSSILKGQDYTFAPTDTDNYTYTNVQATVNGTQVTITPTADGKSFTIAGADVTGDIVITYDKAANVYDVTVDEPDGHEGKVTYDKQATYGVQYTFTIPENTEATKTDAGYTYSATVTVNGATYNAERDGLKYTIAGEDISGNIEITLVVQVTPALGLDTYTVTVQGSTDVKVNDADSVTVTEGEEVTLTLTPETGYIYEIKVNNEVVTLEDNSYTFTVNSNVTVAVTKNLDVSTVQVFKYATMDTVGSAWLITFDGTLDARKIPTYNGNSMYWSAKYDAYCYLEIAATLSADGSDDVPGAKSKIGVTTATAPVVDYGMDINGTDVTDAADAQMIWNMYSAEYNSFDEGDTTVNGVAMEKFLAADQNATSSDTANWKLTVEDAQVIIAAILAGNATT